MHCIRAYVVFTNFLLFPSDIISGLSLIIVIVKISIPKLIVLKKMFEEGVGTLFGQIVFEGEYFLSGASLIVQAQTQLI